MRIMVLGDRNELFGEFRTEGTEVMDPNVAGLSQGGLGRFGEGCFSRRWGNISRDIPVMCKGSIE